MNIINPNNVMLNSKINYCKCIKINLNSIFVIAYDTIICIC